MQHLEIAADHFAHARTQHLHDDFAPVDKGRRVHLGDGGGRERRLLETAEKLRDRLA